jgi:multicomponent Na+:H+ antiporter subunit F
MTVLATVTLLVAIVGLAATALLSLIRIVRGPTILDRMIAADVLLTTIMLAAGTDMVLRNETTAIPLMVVIAATSVLATIVVARFVRRREQDEAFTGPAPRADSGGGSHD